jgi:tryptophan synthase beta chain
MGAFYEFIEDEEVELHAVEAGGSSLETDDERAPNSASLNIGDEGVLHGARTKILQNEDGQILESHSLSAGLDYSGVGPELAALVDEGRVEPATADDEEAMNAFQVLSEDEGIIPALEPSHAVAHVLREGEALGDYVVINLCGRGDKDLETAMESIGMDMDVGFGEGE